MKWIGYIWKGIVETCYMVINWDTDGMNWDGTEKYIGYNWVYTVKELEDTDLGCDERIYD